ncbi:MAG: prolyl oligopeptidase family serine peptidase [Ruminococcus sp.]|nr:prolyl oligopeptidase family serine peptidase [Ruminococcus sp.]
MKRILSVLLLSLTVLCSLWGCSNNSVSTDKTQTSVVNFCAYEDTNGISQINEIVLPKTLSKECKTYKFTYSSHSNNIKGYISIPNNCNSNSPFKCILYNRGGNSRIGLLTDTDTAQICSQLDRVVVASQYRGADSGTGKDEFGGADLNDLTTLVDLCESAFDFIDMTDFCVAGVSRGGMMAYMLARSDHRISRIIAVSAVSDLSRAYNEREDMRTLLTNCIGGSPEALPNEYEKRSAICWADEITVPVLMIHSKGDEQVSFSQAEALKAEFDKNGTPCTFVTYNDSTHGMHKEDISVIKDWLSK